MLCDDVPDLITNAQVLLHPYSRINPQSKWSSLLVNIFMNILCTLLLIKIYELDKYELEYTMNGEAFL